MKSWKKVAEEAVLDMAHTATFLELAIEGWLDNNGYLLTKYNKDRLRHFLITNFYLILENRTEYIEGAELELEAELYSNKVKDIYENVD